MTKRLDTTINVCLDNRKCRVNLKNTYKVLSISKGARILSSIHHLEKKSVVLPPSTEAIQYKTRKGINLVVINDADTRENLLFLRRITFQRSMPSLLDKNRATRICTTLDVDGWVVKRKTRKEAIVLMKAKDILV